MNLFDEGIKGIMYAEKDTYSRLDTEYGYGIYRKDLSPDRVRVILTGGGGRGFMWAGCAREGIAHAVVHGEADSAPNAYAIYEMARTVDAGKGVLLLSNNFMGDYLNDDMAVELMADDGIEGRYLMISDDIRNGDAERGGLSGVLQAAKAAYKAAEEGKTLEEVYETAEYAAKATRSLSALIEGDRLIYGQGFSGEECIRTEAYESEEGFVSNALDMLIEDYGEKPERVFLAISVSGPLTYIESMSLLSLAVTDLSSRDIEVTGTACGRYFDVFEQKGCIFTLTAIDEVTEKYIETIEGKGIAF